MRSFPPADRTVLTEWGPPDHALAFVREAMRQGTDGCAWDNVAWVGPWATDLSAVTAPTWLWYGSDDPLAPLSHGEWLLERLPNAALVVRPGEGHLGIYTHWDEIASTLAATRSPRPALRPARTRPAPA